MIVGLFSVWMENWVRRAMRGRVRGKREGCWRRRCRAASGRGSADAGGGVAPLGGPMWRRRFSMWRGTRLTRCRVASRQAVRPIRSVELHTDISPTNSHTTVFIPSTTVHHVKPKTNNGIQISLFTTRTRHKENRYGYNGPLWLYMYSFTKHDTHAHAVVGWWANYTVYTSTRTMRAKNPTAEPEIQEGGYVGGGYRRRKRCEASKRAGMCGVRVL